jgi:hypothetical protein
MVRKSANPSGCNGATLVGRLDGLARGFAA